MRPSLENGTNSQTKAFSGELPFAVTVKTDSAIDFKIFTTDTAEGFSVHQLIDVRHSPDLSSLLVNQNLTNVRFQVGDEVIPAHRSVIAARSPVLATLLSAHFEDKERSKGAISIPSVQPDVFRALLRFLYSGNRVNTVTDRHQLGAAAEEFQVLTLASLCRAAASGPSNYEGLINNASFS